MGSAIGPGWLLWHPEHGPVLVLEDLPPHGRRCQVLNGTVKAVVVVRRDERLLAAWEPAWVSPELTR